MIYHVDRLNAQIINEGPHGEDNSPPPRQNHPYGEVIKSIRSGSSVFYGLKMNFFAHLHGMKVVW